MAEKDSKCGTCLFWQDRNIIGQCHRYPTTVNKHRIEWCGEHRSKEVEPRKPGRPKKDAAPAA